MSMLDIPGYTVQRTLGKGGMATVYLAVQDKFEREVALKVMAPALSADEGFRERFLREAKIVAKISHPNIVAVYDVNEVNGIHYIAMEYHSGGDLKSRLREGLSIAEILRITKDMARALDYAHSKGYLHRDIKPDNILFRVDGSAILTDFGIAKATEGDANLTQMGMVAGTPKYMSPEQARGQALASDSDFYSLGVVLYEMLTGRLPYEAPDPIALGILHMNAPIPKLEGRLAHFQPLIDHMLAKNAEQRPKNGAQLIAEIDALEKGFDFSRTQESPADSSTVLRPAANRASPAPVRAGSDDATVMMPSSASLPTADAGPSRGPVLPALVALALIAGGGGWWWYSQARPVAPAVSVATTDAVTTELAAARAALARHALLAPADDNALAHFRRVLAAEPDNSQAREGLKSVADALQAQAQQALSAHRLEEAEQLLAAAADAAPQNAGLADLQKVLAAEKAGTQKEVAVKHETKRREETVATVSPAAAPAVDSLARLRISGMLGSARQALSDGDTPTAIARYQQVLKLDPQNHEAREGLRQAQAK